MNVELAKGEQALVRLRRIRRSPSNPDFDRENMDFA
jgi:hypothetical protein